jgi:hypothetical protein
LWPEYDWINPILAEGERIANAYGQAMARARQTLNSIRQLNGLIDEQQGIFYRQHRNDTSSSLLGDGLAAFETLKRQIRSVEGIVDSIWGDLNRWSEAGAIGGHVGFLRDTFEWIKPGSSDAWKVGVRIDNWLPNLQRLTNTAKHQAEGANNALNGITSLIRGETPFFKIPPWALGLAGAAAVTLFVSAMIPADTSIFSKPFQPPPNSEIKIVQSVKASDYADPFKATGGSAAPGAPLDWWALTVAGSSVAVVGAWLFISRGKVLDAEALRANSASYGSVKTEARNALSSFLSKQASSFTSPVGQYLEWTESNRRWARENAPWLGFLETGMTMTVVPGASGFKTASMIGKSDMSLGKFAAQMRKEMPEDFPWESSKLNVYKFTKHSSNPREDWNELGVRTIKDYNKVSDEVVRTGEKYAYRYQTRDGTLVDRYGFYDSKRRIFVAADKYGNKLTTFRPKDGEGYLLKQTDLVCLE